MDAEAPWTVGRVLQWTAPYFQQKGIEAARLDAEVLLAHVLCIDRLRLYTGYDRPLMADELAAYRGLVQRRAKREPVAYLVGKKGFHAIELAVDERVLIPRPETELLVELGKKALPPGARFADVGTGSGAIALALLAARPDTCAVATDISQDALALAKKNAAALGLEARIDFRAGDLLAPLGGERFDAILSNPPYVETDAALAPEVRDFEPHGALFAGRDGLTLLRALLEQARAQSPGTRLFFEHGRGQAAALCAFAEALGYSGVSSERDLDGHERVLCAQR